ncbi:MAG: HPr family phosphocarrier protein [Lysobacteraceae bacterium]
MTIEREIEVTNKLGLHARAAAKLVRALAPFKSAVWLGNGSREINAKSIMGVMLLAAPMGSRLQLRIEGEDEAAVLAAVLDLLERRFDEESP